MDKQQTKHSELSNKVNRNESKMVGDHNYNFDRVVYTPNKSMFSVIKKKKVSIQSYESVLFFTKENSQPSTSIRKVTKKNHTPITQQYTVMNTSQKITHSQQSLNILNETKPFRIMLPSIKELFSANQTSIFPIDHNLLHPTSNNLSI
ncbi:predicted protein [Naegleria gruberi]|uniref:Predicted protein n=1 Tax=Naegleria gruberi TaxID=5762 RepID=D2V8X2_NAEGR|nr:uncharacterized protein NAEGRDRAFT_65314 [Naegleria gruberi]EFC46876.1 predicted protein [Naegleria gruberi]|eukprot:XP_002679620.1 predicted protein [Naegleria gruberi strain NEG-M]